MQCGLVAALERSSEAFRTPVGISVYLAEAVCVSVGAPRTIKEALLEHSSSEKRIQDSTVAGEAHWDVCLCFTDSNCPVVEVALPRMEPALPEGRQARSSSGSGYRPLPLQGARGICCLWVCARGCRLGRSQARSRTTALKFSAVSKCCHDEKLRPLSSSVPNASSQAFPKPSYISSCLRPCCGRSLA